MNIHELYRIYRINPFISTDSRNIDRNCLFFALKGDKFNGNLFVNEALEKGASWAVADEKECQPGERIIRVKDVLKTLQQLASYHRQNCKFNILAITGSNGKTTTKDLCSSILAIKYKVYATHGNLNNHIGVPLTLLSMLPETEVGIIEMGANHPGEITLLCNIAKPDYGLITNIGKAHLEGFGSIDGVALAKGELFQYLTNRNGIVFANTANPYIRKMLPAKKKNVIRYNSPDTVWGEVNDLGLFLEIKVHDNRDIIPVKSHLVGKYNAENIIAAYVIGKYFGIPPPGIAEKIALYSPSNNRSQFIKTTHNEIIMDAYNANPTSMKAAIENFIAVKPSGGRIILGEMLELGESSTYEHQAITDWLKKQSFQQVIFVGNGFKLPALSAGYTWYPDVESLKAALLASPIYGSFILVKGSRGNQLEKIMDLL
ncbi:MAG: UDP-N-acetylmuramoyl-tripeptide--D-alanyl-D-alanine ligase [Bacteroidales bacterium]|nr:UDP-N-acetylmuramoyl-tripeptide--D-alanyl-D-alanine ligase [Bacteroidales bacterium]